MYPPLWTNYLVAMHDDIKNRSISLITLQTQKLRPQKIIVKTTLQSDLSWSAIFSVIVSSFTRSSLQMLSLLVSMQQGKSLAKTRIFHEQLCDFKFEIALVRNEAMLTCEQRKKLHKRLVLSDSSININITFQSHFIT